MAIVLLGISKTDCVRFRRETMLSTNGKASTHGILVQLYVAERRAVAGSCMLRYTFYAAAGGKIPIATSEVTSKATWTGESGLPVFFAKSSHDSVSNCRVANRLSIMRPRGVGKFGNQNLNRKSCRQPPIVLLRFVQATCSELSTQQCAVWHYSLPQTIF